MLHGLRGTPPDAWRWLAGAAAWRPTRDRDGDGLCDWVREKERLPVGLVNLGPNNTVLLSGLTGRVLALQDQSADQSDEDRGRDQLRRSQAIGARTGEPVGKWLKHGEERYLVSWSPTWSARLRMQIELVHGKPGDQVMEAGTALFGVDPRTGRPRWRCDIPEGNHTLTLLLDDHPRGLPRVVFPCARQATPALPYERWAVIAREALPSGPDGRYLLPEGHPREYGELPEDPRWVRPLPWVELWSSGRIHLAWLPYSALVILVVYGIARRRWRLLAWFLATFVLSIPGGVAVSYFLDSYVNPLRLMSMQRYSTKGWYQISLYGFYGTGWIALVFLAGFVLSWLGRKIADQRQPRT
jgi:hypothetical protein